MDVSDFIVHFFHILIQFAIGTKFNDVDLTEKEWVEYDEKNKTSVGIYDFESKFIKIK